MIGQRLAELEFRCSTCDNWTYDQSDDGGWQFGKCAIAYEGTEDRYASSHMLLKLEGPEDATERVSPHLLTAEDHYCHQWTKKRGT